MDEIHERSVDRREDHHHGGFMGSGCIEINDSSHGPHSILDPTQPYQSFRRNPMYLPPANSQSPPSLIPTNSLSSLRANATGQSNHRNNGARNSPNNTSVTTTSTSTGRTGRTRPQQNLNNRNNHSSINHIQSLSSSSSNGDNNVHDNNSRQLNANMIKSGLYPVSDPRAKPSRAMTFLGLFCRVFFAFSMIAIPILVLFYFIYYEPLHNMMTTSSSDQSTARSMLFSSNPSNQIYKVDALSSVFVKTKAGTVQGERIDILNKEIDVFLGIPFAEPPLGDLRFRKPREVKPWNGIYRGIRHSRPCLQYRQDHRFSKEAGWISPVLSSEDCLYLNIWASVNKKPSLSNLKPVLIIIHGGHFISGSSDIDALDGGILAAFGDIVVVTFNYRLGVLGFLNSNHESSPGNVGLHDQAAAIKWVRNNIEAFGGDPEKITLASHGNSAGFHLISPVTRDLFRRAIIMSGSPLTPQILEDASLSLDRSQQLAVRVSCANDRVNIYKHPEDVVNCLRKLEGNFLAKAADDMMTGIHPPFSASVGNEFLPFNPYGAIKVEGELGHKKEVMIGSVKDEGSLLLHATFPKIFMVNNPKKVSAQQVVPLIEEAFRFLPNPGPKMITHFFMTDLNTSDHNTIREKFYETIGDFVTLCPAVFFSEQMALQNFTLYHYFFTHRPSNSKWGRWMGVVNFDEVPFLTGMPFTKPNDFSEDEREFSARLMENWINFIKNGKPNAQLGRTWPKYYPEERKYMKLDPYSNEVGIGPHEHQCNLWRFMFQTAAKP